MILLISTRSSVFARHTFKLFEGTSFEFLSKFWMSDLDQFVGALSKVFAKQVSDPVLGHHVPDVCSR